MLSPQMVSKNEFGWLAFSITRERFINNHGFVLHKIFWPTSGLPSCQKHGKLLTPPPH
jgi:hypothetical protein